MPSAWIALVALGVLAAAAFLEVKQRRLRAFLPPGPKPHWLRGTALPSTYSWRALAEIAHQFGGVATVWQGRTPLVVVGSVEAADYLCVRLRSRPTTDRSGSRSTQRRLLIGRDR